MRRGALWSLAMVAAAWLGVGVGSAETLSDLPRLSGPPLARVSSADPAGANADFREVPAGGKLVLFERSGAGRIVRLWCTLATKEPAHLRKVVIRMYWDGEAEPSVNCPLGDFFGLSHGLYYHLLSTPINAAVGKGLSCFLPMPYASGARIEIENQGAEPIRKFYWNIDYQDGVAPDAEEGRLHACFHRENPTEAKPGSGPEENYVLLDVRGKGRFAGCLLGVQRLQPAWWGEGDERIETDGRTLLGTGLEDYFNCAWEFTQPFCAPAFGVPYIDPGKDPQRIAAYRWHLDDPIVFSNSLRVSMEHGNQNDRADDWSSVAYWYQQEPHQPFELPPVDARLPREAAGTAVSAESAAVSLGAGPKVEQPKPRIVVPPVAEEERSSAAVAVMLVAQLTWIVTVLGGIAALAWWYLRRRRA